MKKILYSMMIILLVPSFFVACSGEKKETKSNAQEINDKSVDLFTSDKEPFYTVEPKLEDIESEIALLKEKVIQYESQISTPNFNTEILKLIKAPKIKHEIELSNGTIIQGTIIYENVDQIILETQIGQLQINKDEIIKTSDVLPPIAKLEFVGDAIEEIYEDQRRYNGTIRNDGLRRADFVRIIYTMHDQESNIVATDSAFVKGEKKIFNSGIISDASIEPGGFADFYVIIDVDSEKNIQYFLRDIKWEYVE